MERNAANEHEARMRKAAQYLAARDAARNAARSDEGGQPRADAHATSADGKLRWVPDLPPAPASAGDVPRMDREQGQAGGMRGDAQGSLATDRAAQADAAVRDAIARGEFDNLSLAG